MTSTLALPRGALASCLPALGDHRGWDARVLVHDGRPLLAPGGRANQAIARKGRGAVRSAGDIASDRTSGRVIAALPVAGASYHARGLDTLSRVASSGGERIAKRASALL